MLDKKIIAAGIAITLAAVGFMAVMPTTEAVTYECYYWKLAPDKPLIICNYPGTTDMFHSYLKEKDLQDAAVTGGFTYTYSGKHPSGATTYTYSGKQP